MLENQLRYIERIKEIYARLEPGAELDILETLIRAVIRPPHGRGAVLMIVCKSKITAMVFHADHIGIDRLAVVRRGIVRMNKSLPESAAFGISGTGDSLVFAAEHRLRKSDPADDARLAAFCTEVFRTAPARLEEVAAAPAEEAGKPIRQALKKNL